MALSNFMASPHADRLEDRPRGTERTDREDAEGLLAQSGSGDPRTHPVEQRLAVVDRPVAQGIEHVGVRATLIVDVGPLPIGSNR